MVLPTIVIVPGLWFGPKPYELLEQEMKKLLPSLPDFVYAPLASTGKASPGNPNMTDDSLSVRQIIKPLVEAGKRLVLIGHSTGALVAAGSTKDLEFGEKLAVPNGGGVERFVFIVGGILPVGSPHPPMSFFRYEDGKAFCKDPDGTLFHDVDPSTAAKYWKFSSFQPAENWIITQQYVGFEKFPSTYIFTENDRVILPEVQEICAGIAKAEVVRIPTGHCPFLSDPKMLAEKVIASLKLTQ